MNLDVLGLECKPFLPWCIAFLSLFVGPFPFD